MSHRCCECGEDPTCNCLGDCNDHEADGALDAASCWGCCWSTGDQLRLKHDWGTEVYTKRETCYAPTRCGDVDYQGGSIEVEYLAFGCSTSCPDVHTDRVKVLFALNTRVGGVVFDKVEQKYVVNGDGWQYPIPQYVALVCQTEDGAGDFEWWWYNSCNDPNEFQPCVSPCRVGCAEVIYETCNDVDAAPYCGGGTCIPRDGPDTYNCENCLDAVVDCGGMRAYCALRRVTKECAMSGQEYGQKYQGDPPELACVTDCGAEMDGDYHPLETCEVAYVQTLSLLPPAGAERNCLWHEWTDGDEDYWCCRSAAKVEGGEDLPGPAALDDPTIDDQSWPDTGWTANPGPCDCFVNPQTVTECDEIECPAVTELVNPAEQTICNP